MSYDSYGVQYENNVLKTTTDRTSYFVLKRSCKTIFGTSDQSYAFINCKSTLQTFSVEDGSELQTIQQYAFYQCTALENADFSKCTSLNSIGSHSFYGCSSLSTVILPNSLLSIEDCCFSNCGLTAMTIPESVNKIGKELFKSNSKLTSVIFEGDSNITKFPDSTFRDTNISSIIIPRLVTTIGGNAFESTSSLSKIEVAEGNTKYIAIDYVLYEKDTMILIHNPSAKTTDNFIMPNNVTAVASLSLSSSKIKNVTFSNIIHNISSYSFQYSLVEIIILPDSVTLIDTRAFYSCSNLYEVRLPNNITSLPFKGFYGTAITTIVIPESVTEIKANCFESCSKLTSVTLPSSIKKLGGGVFANCGEINITFGNDSDFTINEDYLITDKDKTSAQQYLGDSPNLTIPSTIERLLSSCFSGVTTLEIITFESPSSLKSIDYQCFYNCINLKNITFPSTLTKIGEEAFYNCISLKSLQFSSSLTKISRYGFYNCTGLHDIDFQENEVSTRKILSYQDITFDEYCFAECSNLYTVHLPYGIKSIGPQCFANCLKLMTINLPETLTNCSAGAFNSTGLNRIDIPCGLTTISAQLFYNSSQLEEVEISDTVTSIENEAFAYTALKIVTIPPSVKTIGTRCFESCHNLTQFIIESENSSLNEFGHYVFKDCISLTEFVCNSSHFITERGVLYSYNMDELVFFPPASEIQFFSIPERLKIISPSAFCQCNNLIQVMIPDNSVETISLGAFENCKNLVTINIPKCVHTIQQNAFEGCNKLSCGIVIENRTDDILDQLIKASIPRRALKPCTNTACAQTTSNHQFLCYIILAISQKY